jgi:hypothetical protein
MVGVVLVVMLPSRTSILDPPWGVNEKNTSIIIPFCVSRKNAVRILSLDRSRPAFLVFFCKKIAKNRNMKKL